MPKNNFKYMSINGTPFRCQQRPQVWLKQNHLFMVEVMWSLFFWEPNSIHCLKCTYHEQQDIFLKLVRLESCVANSMRDYVGKFVK